MPLSGLGAGEMTSLRSWIYQNKLTIRSKDKRTPNTPKPVETHLLLDGGRLVIPPELTKQFHQQYAQSLLDREFVYVVEKRTPIFHMFAEIDYKSKAALEECDAINIAKFVQTTVIRPLFTNPQLPVPMTIMDDALRVVVSMPRTETVESPRLGEPARSGIHLNWRIPISDQNAKLVRNLFISEMIEATTIDERDHPRIQGTNTSDVHIQQHALKTIDAYFKGTASPSVTQPVAQSTCESVNEASSIRRQMWEMAHSDKVSMVPWSEVFDILIYEHCGLRMMGSRKAKKCPDCQNNPCHIKDEVKPPPIRPALAAQLHIRQVSKCPTLCATCQGTGKMDQGRAYAPIAVLDRNGHEDSVTLERLLTDMRFMVAETCIRIVDAITEMPMLNDSMVNVAGKIEKANKRIRPRKLAKKENVERISSSESANQPNSRNTIRENGGLALTQLLRDDIAYPILSDVVTSLFGLNKNKVGESNVRSIKTNLARTVYIVNTDSRYCLNKNAEHNRATVYFVVRPEGAVQKCFSKKSVVYMPSGRTCAEYSSFVHPLPHQVVERLFTKYAKRLEDVMFNQSSKIKKMAGTTGKARTFDSLSDDFAMFSPLSTSLDVTPDVSCDTPTDSAIGSMFDTSDDPLLAVMSETSGLQDPCSTDATKTDDSSSSQKSASGTDDSIGMGTLFDEENTPNEKQLSFPNVEHGLKRPGIFTGMNVGNGGVEFTDEQPAAQRVRVETNIPPILPDEVIIVQMGVNNDKDGRKKGGGTSDSKQGKGGGTSGSKQGKGGKKKLEDKMHRRKRIMAKISKCQQVLQRPANLTFADALSLTPLVGKTWKQ